MRIKRDADQMMDFCGYLFATAEVTGLYIGNARVRPSSEALFISCLADLYAGERLP
jgi:hypothetical protein